MQICRSIPGATRDVCLCLKRQGKSLCMQLLSSSVIVNSAIIAECAVTLNIPQHTGTQVAHCPLQVSADCLVLHVLLQYACIHNTQGIYRSSDTLIKETIVFTKRTHKDDQTISHNIQKHTNQASLTGRLKNSMLSCITYQKLIQWCLLLHLLNACF